MVMFMNQACHGGSKLALYSDFDVISCFQRKTCRKCPAGFSFGQRCVFALIFILC